MEPSISIIDIREAAFTDRDWQSLNEGVLPINFAAALKKLFGQGHEFFIRVAWSGDTPVAALCGYLESVQHESYSQRMWIATLAVRAVYRRLGLGAKLVNCAIAFAQSRDEIGELALHVQVDNEAALALYQSCGFVIAETVKNYYPGRSFKNRDAYLMKKELARETTTADVQVGVGEKRGREDAGEETVASDANTNENTKKEKR